jgi:hypothetical protein
MHTNTNRKGGPDALPQIDERTELRMGMLVAESDTGGYEPVAAVINVREAREIAAYNFRRRMADLQNGREPMCPERYVLWSQGSEGEYRIVAEILPN